MSLTSQTDPAGSAPEHRSWRRFGRGRSEFLVVALLLAIAVFLTIGTATMNVQGEAVPGPRFFPAIVCIVLYATTIALALDVLRRPRLPGAEARPGGGDSSAEGLRDLGHPEEGAAARQAGTAEPAPGKSYSDWKTVGQVVGGVVVFTLLLPVVGWILCAAFLFWGVAHALGSRRPAFDLGVALLFSSAIQLAFNGGLGLNLPPGFLEGVL